MSILICLDVNVDRLVCCCHESGHLRSAGIPAVQAFLILMQFLKSLHLASGIMTSAATASNSYWCNSVCNNIKIYFKHTEYGD